MRNQLIAMAVFVALFAACTDEGGTECRYKDDFRHGSFMAYTELHESLECAKKVKKPLLIIFTGYSSMSLPGLPWKIMEVPEIK